MNALAVRASARETLLVELTQWLMRVMQYSVHHPSCAQLGERVLESAQRALAESSPVAFGVLKDGVTLDDGVLSKHVAVNHRLARHLHERGVLVLRFLDGVRLDELTRLLDVLLLPVQTIFDLGGVAQLLEERGITRVQVEQLEHDISVEERNAQLRRRGLRTFFGELLQDLRAERRLGRDVGAQLADLLSDPRTAVDILEDDPLEVCDAVAALCLEVRRDEERTGEALFPRLEKILLALTPASHDRLLLGFPSLVGDFRDALGWALRRLAEQSLARIVFASLRLRGGDLDAVFYALGVVVPHDGDRRALLRRTALLFYDLPLDDAYADELLRSATLPVGDFHSYHRERELLAADAAGAIARRTFFARAPAEGAPPPRADGYDARRSVAEVVKTSARTRRFDRLCSRLPETATALAQANATDATLGILDGLRAASSRGEWRELAARTLGAASSPVVVGRILASLESAASASEGTELDGVIRTIRELVPLNPAAVLERLELCESRKIRRILLDALPRAGAALLPLVRANLRSEKWFVVRNAVHLLPGVGGTARDLAAVARHPNEKIRIEVARMLPLVPADSAAADLAASFLEDPSPEVRLRARAVARGELLSPVGIQVLERIASDDAQPDDVRRFAIEAIGRSRDDAAATALFALIQPRSLLELGTIRELAAVALRSSPAPRAPHLFAEGLRSSVLRVRKACERAAGQ